MNVLFAAGGTGGHLYPGLAVAKEFQAEGHQVHFVVKKGDYVLSLLEREKIPFSAISAAGFKRSLSPDNLLTPLKLVRGFFESIRILNQFDPHLVIVMGGYLSVPVALVARLRGIPLLLHEQNVLPGLANRFLSHIATKVAVSFPQSLSYFGKNAELTGNPLRPEFRLLPSRGEALQHFNLDSGKTTVLIFGGSLGAQKINHVVIKALRLLVDRADKIQILHFTGPQEEESMDFEYRSLPFTFFVGGYCHDMVSAYAAADFVICRAGASTVTELIAAKKPAILIPYPYATGDHQKFNAKVVTDAQAGLLFQEKELDADNLKQIIENVIDNPKKIQDWKSGFSRITLNPIAAAGKIKNIGKALVIR